MLLGLTAGQKLGLAIVAGLFIAFALASSFLLPRRDANFPGERRMRLFVVVSVLFVVAMLGAMYVLADEGEEGHAAGEAGTGAEHGETGTTETEGAETEAGTTGGGEGGGEGDPEAGRAIFTGEAGCSGCHTLAEADASGTVGPNLDETQPSFDVAVTTITNGRGAMPAFEDRLTEERIGDVAAFVAEASGG